MAQIWSTIDERNALYRKRYVDPLSESLLELATAPCLLNDSETAVLVSWIDQPFSTKLPNYRFILDVFAGAYQSSGLRLIEDYVSAGDALFTCSCWWNDARQSYLDAEVRDGD